MDLYRSFLLKRWNKYLLMQRKIFAQVQPYRHYMFEMLERVEVALYKTAMSLILLLRVRCWLAASGEYNIPLLGSTPAVGQW